jgi:YD repeat-containing protein
MIPKVVRMEKVKARTSRTYRLSYDDWKRTSTSHLNAGRLSRARGERRPTRLS